MNNVLAISPTYFNTGFNVLDTRTTLKNNFEVVCNVAVLNIFGSLQKNVDVTKRSVSGERSLSYFDISKILTECEENSEVASLALIFNSHGGVLDGLANLARQISNIKKPKIAYCESTCLSAAYWLASACDKIIATSETASFGSIGVIVEYEDKTKQDDRNGIQKYILVNSKSQNKHVDISSEDGRVAIIKNLDACFDIFLKHVCKFRNVSEEFVLENFGKGGYLLAGDALKVKMIDKIVLMNNLDSIVENTKNLTKKIKGIKMTEEEIRALVDARVEAKLNERLTEYSTNDVSADYLNDDAPLEQNQRVMQDYYDSLDKSIMKKQIPRYDKKTPIKELQKILRDLSKWIDIADGQSGGFDHTEPYLTPKIYKYYQDICKLIDFWIAEKRKIEKLIKELESKKTNVKKSSYDDLDIQANSEDDESECCEDGEDEEEDTSVKKNKAMLTLRNATTLINPHLQHRESANVDIVKKVLGTRLTPKA